NPGKTTPSELTSVTMNSAAILGSGSFGTALAVLLAPKLNEIVLIGRDEESISSINRDHVNPKYLKRTILPSNIRATSALSAAVSHPLVIFGVPTSATRSVANELAGYDLPIETILL